MRFPGEFTGVSTVRYIIGLILWCSAAFIVYGIYSIGISIWDGSNILYGQHPSELNTAYSQNPADQRYLYAQPPPPPASSTDFLTKGLEILFSQGLSGVFIALLTYILYITNKQATKERSEHMESVKELWKDNMASTSELATEVKEMHSEFRERLADHSARLQNIEREVEYKRDR